MDLNQLKRQKKEQKLTFEELSLKSGVPLQTLHNIFRGHTTNPRIDTVEAIEKALGIKSGSSWTKEEIALGVIDYSNKLSPDEWEWLELRSEVLRIKGETYLKTLIEMINGALK